jgi:hypothetical protein
MIQPRLNWSLILSGQVELEYQFSIIGLFNIAGSIAYIKGRSDLVKQYEKV